MSFIVTTYKHYRLLIVFDHVKEVSVLLLNQSPSGLSGFFSLSRIFNLHLSKNYTSLKRRVFGR